MTDFSGIGVTATAGQTQVPLGVEPDCAWVTVNGSRVSAGPDYTITGDRIVFVSPLNAGDQVTVRWPT